MSPLRVDKENELIRENGQTEKQARGHSMDTVWDEKIDKYIDKISCKVGK
jgi:hypothetical protein